MSDEHITMTDGDKEVKSANLVHETWLALDQQLLGFLHDYRSHSASRSLQKCGCGMEDDRAFLWLPDLGTGSQCSSGFDHDSEG
jgi:hypothetical protein